MKKSVGDSTYHQWLKTSISEWQFLDTAPAGKDGKKTSQQAPYVDYAAEAEFTALDEERGFVILQISDNTKIKVLRNAVAGLAGEPETTAVTTTS